MKPCREPSSRKRSSSILERFNHFGTQGSKTLLKRSTSLSRNTSSSMKRSIPSSTSTTAEFSDFISFADSRLDLSLSALSQRSHSNSSSNLSPQSLQSPTNPPPKRKESLFPELDSKSMNRRVNIIDGSAAYTPISPPISPVESALVQMKNFAFLSTEPELTSVTTSSSIHSSGTDSMPRRRPSLKGVFSSSSSVSSVDTSNSQPAKPRKSIGNFSISSFQQSKNTNDGKRRRSVFNKIKVIGGGLLMSRVDSAVRDTDELSIEQLNERLNKMQAFEEALRDGKCLKLQAGKELHAH